MVHKVYTGGPSIYSNHNWLTTIKESCSISTVHYKFIDKVDGRIFREIKIAIVAISGGEISVLLVPFGIFNHLCSNRFANPTAFSYELLYVTIKVRPYLYLCRLTKTLSISVRLDVLPFGMVVERSLNRASLLIVPMGVPSN